MPADIAIIAENELLKQKVKDLELRISLMKTESIQREFFMLSKERELTKHIRDCLTNIEFVLESLKAKE